MLQKTIMPHIYTGAGTVFKTVSQEQGPYTYMRDLLQEQCTLFHLVPCTVCLRGRKLYRANCIVPRGNRDGAVVRGLAFHQCGLDSIPGLGVICGLSLLLVLLLAPRVFSPGTLVSLPP